MNKDLVIFASDRMTAPWTLNDFGNDLVRILHYGLFRVERMYQTSPPAQYDPRLEADLLRMMSDKVEAKEHGLALLRTPHGSSSKIRFGAAFSRLHTAIVY